MEATKKSLLTRWSHRRVVLLKGELSCRALTLYLWQRTPEKTSPAWHNILHPPTSKNIRGVIKRTRLGVKQKKQKTKKLAPRCHGNQCNDVWDSPKMMTALLGGKKIVRCHLQALGIPRYPFWHGLQTQTLAVHVRAGTAALVRTSTGRGSAQQQQHRSNQSQEPARRTTLPRPGRKHHIHWNHSPKARFRVKICWGSLCGRRDPGRKSGEAGGIYRNRR